MKKIFLVIFLVIIILVSFGFAYLKVSAHGSENNYFNKNLREELSRHPLMRNIIGLHYDGDAKHDYLGREKNRIVIEVDSMKGLNVSSRVFERLSDAIEEITNKEVVLRFSDVDIPYQQELTFDELAKIKEDNQFFRSKDDDVVLYILIASSSGEDKNKLGSTLHENSLIFFHRNIILLSNENNLDNYENIILGTLLHEFGHQLGLNHNDHDECLMNAVNIYDSDLSNEDVVFDFCERELEEIEQIQKTY